MPLSQLGEPLLHGRNDHHMSIRVLGPIALLVLACGACSHDNDSSQAGAKAKDAPPPDANVAAADMGGAVEELTGNYGPGFTGRRLIDGLTDPSWKWSERYKRRALPAGSAHLLLRTPARTDQGAHHRIAGERTRHCASHCADDGAPAHAGAEGRRSLDSMDTATEHFTKAAAATLEAKPGEQTVSFPPVEARFVKLRVLSGAGKTNSRSPRCA